MKNKIHYCIFFFCFVVSSFAADLILSKKPRLHLGEHLGESYEFQGVEAVVLTPKGVIYVLDSSLGTVFKYDLNGQYLGKIGQLGQGPGEFYRPGAIAVVGDFLWVADGGNGRLQIFENDRYLKTIKLDNVPTPNSLAVSNGRVFVASNSFMGEQKAGFVAFDQEGIKRSDFDFSFPPRPNFGVTASLWNTYHLTSFTKDRFILGFNFDNIIMIADTQGKVLRERKMDDLYESYSEKKDGMAFPAGYAAMAFCEGPDETILVSVCDQEKRYCGVVYRLDKSLKKKMQRWDFGSSVRFMKYEEELDLLVVTNRSEVFFYGVD